VNLTILIYFVPYLYLFAAWVLLRRGEPAAAADGIVMSIPGGIAGVIVVAACGFLATLIAITLVFVPPPGTSGLSYEISIAGQTALLFIIGFAFYAFSRRR
jgi:hypothetical protein